MTITNCPMCQWEIPELSEPIRTCLECGADLSRWTARKKQAQQIPAKVQSSDDDGWYFARQAANYSLAAPFIAMAVNGCSRGAIQDNPASKIIMGGISILLIVSGFIFGVIALVRTKKCGREGIFGKAITGVCINGLYIAGILFVFHMLTKIAIDLENDRQRQRQIQRPW